MRRLFPDPVEVDPVDAYGRLNRLATVHACARTLSPASMAPGSLDARSPSPGGPADKALFSALRSLADVILVGAVDLADALRALGELGHDNVLAEGGPGVAAQLASADLLDELCITLSPVLTAGDAGRILNGHPIEPPTRLELHHVLESESLLFLRDRRR